MTLPSGCIVNPPDPAVPIVSVARAGNQLGFFPSRGAQRKPLASIAIFKLTSLGGLSKIRALNAVCADRCLQGGGAVQAWSIIEAGMVEQAQNLGATGAVEQAIMANPGSVIPPQAKDILVLDTMMLAHAASILEPQPARWYLPFAPLLQARSLTGFCGPAIPRCSNAATACYFVYRREFSPSLRTNPRVEFDYEGSIHATVEIYRSLGVGCGDHLLDVCVWLGWPCAARVLKAFRQGAFETQLSARLGSFVPRPAAYFCGAAASDICFI